MKRVLLVVAAIATFGFANAQENNGQTAKGKWLLESNTGFGNIGNTGFSLTLVEGETAWSVGGDAGYFVMDRLAIKLGLGYVDFGGGSDGLLLYKIGAKYYLQGNIPLAIDFLGSSTAGSTNYIGAQAGYAWFLGDHVSIEPGVRFNLALSDIGSNFLQLNVGFVIHL